MCIMGFGESERKNERKRKRQKEEDYLKWPDKNMLALTFDSKIKKKITIIQLNS